MTTHIALLRAVNLPAHKNVAMADLRAMLTSLKLGNPRSLLQSGNLVFECAKKTPAQLEQFLEAESKKRLGLETDYFVRTGGEWEEAIANNPFAREAIDDPAHLVLMPLRDAPTAASVTALQKAVKGRELVRAKGRYAYLVYPDGIGTSKFTIRMIERGLATRGTGRNWNTVLKLAKAAAAESQDGC